MKKELFLLMGWALLLVACNSNNKVAEERMSSIDSTVQSKVADILAERMEEVGAKSGQVIVMDVQTGEILAMVGEAASQESGLVRTASLLAALETGRVKMSDSVDVGDGVYAVGDANLYDHNWRRGGYGKMTVSLGFQVSSNIANYKVTKLAFNEEQAYFDMLGKMSYGQPAEMAGMDSLKAAHFFTPQDSGWSEKSLAWFCIGYNQRIAPIQMLTFYNAIANGGKMMRPSLYKGEAEVINPQIASEAGIDSMRMALRKYITDGLGRHAESELVDVAGAPGTIQASTEEDKTEGKQNTDFHIEFCGYFPADAPRYSVIVSMNKMGLPASGGAMAGSVFKEIAECIMSGEKE